jgi:hypothetical protein
MFSFNPTPFIVLFFISVPLGMWKLVEIIIWLFNHVKITF